MLLEGKFVNYNFILPMKVQVNVNLESNVSVHARIVSTLNFVTPL